MLRRCLLATAIALAGGIASGGEPVESLVLLRRADLHRSAGELQSALRDAEAALLRAQSEGEPLHVARSAAMLAELHRLAGSPAAAERELSRARTAAAGIPDAGLHALLGVLEANALATQRQPEMAAAAYREAFRRAESADQPALASKALIGLVQVSRRELADAEADAISRQLRRLVARTTDAQLRADLLLASAQAFSAWAQGGTRTRHASTHSEEALRRALRMGEELEQPRIASTALGGLGALLEARGSNEEALALTRRAAFAAQQHPDLQFRWYWQIGRIRERMGEPERAIEAWRLALATLQAIRAPGYSATTEAEVAALHFGFADLLLRRSPHVATSETRRELLREARESIEQLKAAELRDFFRDDCVTELQNRITPIDRLPAGSAALYPVLLPDRLELLLSLPGELLQVTVAVPREELVQAVRTLRILLEKRTTREYLPHAQRVYDWLIRPVEPFLQRASTQTLVVVPEGPLRTIPLAALHDGEKFLIERYAIATTPGLQLTDARPLRHESLEVMLAGVSQSVQGFPGLDGVPRELREIHALVGGTLLQDQQFMLDAFRQQLERKPFTIVHVASHAQFNRDPARTFLLTYDAKLDLEQLRETIAVSEFRKNPIELLTLSACETAAGDDRAALGLAGIAVKAGARSALAGLWYIDDAASSMVLVEFYRQLRQLRLSKADALRQAQIRLIADRRYSHPGYWAPFLLIGNWQ